MGPRAWFAVRHSDGLEAPAHEEEAGEICRIWEAVRDERGGMALVVGRTEVVMVKSASAVVKLLESMIEMF